MSETLTPTTGSRSPEPSPPLLTPGVPESSWRKVMAYLKDIKDVLSAITAIAVAVGFAINYFASAKALECFKTEARRSNELVHTIVQVNELTGTWQLKHTSLRQIEDKLKQTSPESYEYKDLLVQSTSVQSEVEDISAKLKRARDRRSSLDGSNKPCD